MRQPLVAGNWKMSGSIASVRELLAGVKSGVGGQVRGGGLPALYLHTPGPGRTFRYGYWLGWAEPIQPIIRSLHR